MADISQIKLPDGNIHNIVDNTSGYITAESPALTGTPTAPTPLSEASDTQIATVKYVRDSMAGAGAGSVTSVGVANAIEGGLSISGSPITGAGTITVGHSNVLASAQTTAGIYPIKIDKNGHISEYGNAVTIPEVPTNVSSFTNDSGYITTQYIEDKTDYEIPVSRVGEIVVGETAIGTDSTNFPTSKAVVDYVDERVVQEMDAIDVGVMGIKANGTSLAIENGVVNIPAIGPNQSIGLMTNEWMQHIWNGLHSIPTSTSQLTNDSGYVVGPNSSVANHIATFKGTDGKTIQDSGYTIAKNVPSNAVFTDEKVKSTVITSSTTNNYPILLHSNTSSAETASASKTSVFYLHLSTGSDGYYLKMQNAILASEYLTLAKRYNSALYYTKIAVDSTPINSSVILTLPKTTGTIALTSDIPTVPTNISAFTNDSGYITTDSDEKLKTNLITNSEKYYPIFGNSTTNAETKYYDSNISYSTGSGAFSLLTLGSSSKNGSLQLRNSNGGSISLNSDPNSTTTKDIYFQDKTGTVALTSDIPTVPTNISSFTNDSGYLTASDIASVMTYKGTKANYAALPFIGNTTGDVWHLTDTGAEWAWDGSAWQELGSAIGADGYVESSRTVDGTTTNFSNTGTGGSIQSTYQGTDNEAYIQITADNNGASTELYASDGIHYNQISINPIETYISNILTPIDNTDAANKKYVDDSIGAISIPTKTSDLTNDSGFLTSYTETDPVFSASPAASITATDISNWNAKVSDTGKWNDVSLAIQQVTNSGDGTYVPLFNSLDAASVSLTPVKKTPTANVIAKYDANSYLYSTTPSANDNSTKVATTAYVDAAIPNTSNFVSKSGDTMTGKLTLYYNNVGNNNGLIIKDLSNEGGAWLHCEGTISSDTTAKVILRFETTGTSNGVILNGIETPSSNSNDYDKYAANKAYVDNKFNAVSVPTKTSDLTNDSGFITSYTDEKVKLTSTATGGSYPVIFGPTSITSGSTYSINYNSNIVAVPSEGRLDIKRILIRWTDWNDAYVKLDMCSTSGNAPDYYIPTLKFESGAVNTSGGTDKLVQIRGVKTPTDLSTSSMMDYVATVKYVNDSIPKVYSSTNTGGYLTMATLPIYDGTVV